MHLDLEWREVYSQFDTDVSSAHYYANYLLENIAHKDCKFFKDTGNIWSFFTISMILQFKIESEECGICSRPFMWLY